MPRPISRYHATHFSRLVSRRDELRRGRESRSPSFLVAATQQVRRKPQFRLAARPRSRTEASTRAPRAPRAHRAPRVPTGFGLGEPAIASAKSHRARRLTPLRLRHGTLDLAGPKHTPCLRRDARMVATSPPARVVTCVPLPPESLSDSNRARDRTRTARVFGPTRGPARRSRGPRRRTRGRPERTSSSLRALSCEWLSTARVRRGTSSHPPSACAFRRRADGRGLGLQRHIIAPERTRMIFRPSTRERSPFPPRASRWLSVGSRGSPIATAAARRASRPTTRARSVFVPLRRDDLD